MNTLNLPEFLIRDDLGEIFLQGHRICLHHVLSTYAQGDSPEAIVERYPTLPLPLVHKVIAFALDNQMVVEQYLLDIRKTISEQSDKVSTGPGVSVLKKRLQSLSPAQSA